ncbi:hypothetical protein GCM10023172_35740 [Hymenobacter ginsengisoli]|uniref:HTH cro/C1-type domain-containing protein n=1 Tax=Hymenobacter ginsengisoli TaxID=1051626 RepID=A0ABP8QQZ2_9BACT|nr:MULTISPECIES: hypothetical protein [unclassified Hymenobacter]MBO2033882.1 hypothetical protein [Hymenobacter sp. BT559]
MNSVDKDLPAQTFRDLLRHGRFRFTERELMEHLQMTYRTIKRREQDPSSLTVAELLKVSNLLNLPIQDVIAVVIKDIDASSSQEMIYHGKT